MKKNWLDWIVLAITIFCIFSFKFLLIDHQGSGVRLDDFMIVLLFLLFLMNGTIIRTKLPRRIVPFFLYVSVAIFSSLYNGLIGHVDPVIALVFSVRSIEYFTFFYVGVYLARRSIKLNAIFHYFFVFLVILVPLQMLNIVPVVSGFVSTRAIGNTNGPYELAVLTAFLSFFFYFQTPPAKNKAWMAFLILLASASRTTTAAFMLIVASRYQIRKIILFCFALLAVAVVALGITNNDDDVAGDDILSRTSKLASAGLFKALESAYADITPVSTSAEYQKTYFQSSMEDLEGLDADASAYIRFYRWSALIKSVLTNWDSILIGMGPSFGTAAVDGFYMRLFTETGIIGLFLFAWFVIRCIRIPSTNFTIFRYYIITLSIVAVTIDIFVSYKPMLFFWLYFGWLYSNEKMCNPTPEVHQG